MGQILLRFVLKHHRHHQQKKIRGGNEQLLIEGTSQPRQSPSPLIHQPPPPPPHLALSAPPSLLVDCTSSIVHIDAFTSSLGTGDVLLMAGAAASSWLTRISTWSRWSHCGMIDHYAPNGTRFLWESCRDQDGCTDVFSKSSQKKGVRLVLLQQKLKNYAASGSGVPLPGGPPGSMTLDIGLVKLKHAPEFNMEAVLSKRLSDFQNAESHKAFESSKLNMIRAQYGDILGDNVADTREYFCSELLAETYKAIGVIDKRFNSSSCVPETFATDAMRKIPFIDGFYLGPEVYIYRLFIPADPAGGSLVTMTTTTTTTTMMSPPL